MTLTYVNEVTGVREEDIRIAFRGNTATDTTDAKGRHKVSSTAEVTRSDDPNCKEGATMRVLLGIKGHRRVVEFREDGGHVLPCLSFSPIQWNTKKVKHASISKPTPA